MTEVTDRPAPSPWAHDHTSLVHVLWGAGISGEAADTLATTIMHSEWLHAQQRKSAVDALSDEALIADRGLVSKPTHEAVVALNEEIAEKLNFIGRGCYDAPQEELVRRITAVGHAEYKTGDWLAERMRPLRRRNAVLERALLDLTAVYRAEEAGTPLADPGIEIARVLAVAARDARDNATATPDSAPQFDEHLVGEGSLWDKLWKAYERAAHDAWEGTDFAQLWPLVDREIRRVLAAEGYVPAADYDAIAHEVSWRRRAA